MKKIPGLRSSYHYFRRWYFYFTRLGFFNGVTTYIRLRSKRIGIIEVAVLGIKHPVLIRRMTSDVYSFEHIFIFRTYKIHLAKSDGLIIDGGANAGHAAVYFANLFPEKKIVAVEPVAGNAEMIRKNIQPYSNIELLVSAMWNKNTLLKISNPEASNWAFQVQEIEQAEHGSFPAVTIEAIMKQAGYFQIDLLKLDVEGAEKEIFSNNYESWLSKTKCIIIEFHDRFKPGCRGAFHRAANPLIQKTQRIGENEIFFLK